MSHSYCAGLDRSVGTILGGCAGFGTVWIHYQFIKGPYEGESVEKKSATLVILLQDA